MDNVLDCDIKASKLKLQSRNYVRFLTNNLGKAVNPLIPTSYGLNRTITILLQERLRH